MNHRVSSDLKFEIVYDKKPAETILRGRVKFLTFLNELYSKYIILPRMIKKIVKFGRAHQVDRVWCILQGQTMIRLARPVSKKLNVPLYTQIWDHPAWWIKDNHIDNYSSKEILLEFNKAIKESTVCGTASDAMSLDFSEKYSATKTVPLISCLDESLRQEPKVKKESFEEYIIGMAGQLYSLVEWQTMLKALDEINWQYAGKKIKVRYLGYHLNIGSHKPVNIEYLGYRPQKESIELLSQCDILYCPYFFDPAYKIIASSSFPAKLTTYLAAGRPVLFHGPDYSSPAQFLEKYDAASFCYSLNSKDVIDSIDSILSSEKRSKDLVINGKTAFDKNLTESHLKQSLLNFLEIENKDLVGAND